jgi:zinc transport system ATP-binding protein
VGPVIVLNNVSFSYSGLLVLDDVNLMIEQGDFAAIVGPNGGGKTTLLKLISGLLKPDQGKISVFEDSPERVRSNIGYMPQYTYHDVKFPVTVLDVVLMGRLGNGSRWLYSRHDREVALFSLAEVKMADYSNCLFSELSGGQRQRALIARALCCEPKLLLLDEPTANIDPEVEETLFGILQELNHRMTILLVSHDLGFVSNVVKSVVCVNRRVVVHPTSSLDGQIIKEIYGSDLRMIRHDHRCSEKGHVYK